MGTPQSTPLPCQLVPWPPGNLRRRQCWRGGMINFVCHFPGQGKEERLSAAGPGPSRGLFASQPPPRPQRQPDGDHVCLTLTSTAPPAPHPLECTASRKHSGCPDLVEHVRQLPAPGNSHISIYVTIPCCAPPQPPYFCSISFSSTN